MKRPYAESTLKRKYREIGLKNVTVWKLQLYLKACALFYKLVEADEVWKAIQQTEKAYSGKEMEEAITPDLVFAAQGIVTDELRAEFNIQDKLHMDKLRKLLMIMIRPMDPAPTRAQFDAFLRIEEHNPCVYALFEEPEMYDDGVDGKYMIAETRMLLNLPAGLSEEELIDMDDEEIDLSMFTLDRLYALGEAQEGKKLYIPEELLCYASVFYMPITKQAEAIRDWLLNHGFGEDDTDMIVNELYRLVREEPFEGSTSKAVDILTKRDYVFDGIDEVQTYLQLFAGFANHTCLPENKGRMPAEMRSNRGGTPQEIIFGPGMQAAIRNGDIDGEELKAGILGMEDLPEGLKTNMLGEVDRALAPGEERWIGGTLIKGAKIGPNDPW